MRKAGKLGIKRGRGEGVLTPAPYVMLPRSDNKKKRIERPLLKLVLGHKVDEQDD